MRSDQTEPRVGIFWLIEDRLIIDSTPLSEAEPYGAFLGHSKGHPAYWRNLQQNGTVPLDLEYDEVPRGRVGYATQEGRFHVYLDPCILANLDIVSQIRDVLNLPAAATAAPELDAHYRCPGCKKKSKEQLEQEEADWDF